MGRQRVIVGVDRSLAGLRALRLAVAEARRADAVLCAVRAWEVEANYGDFVGPKVLRATGRAARTIDDAFDDIAGGPPADLTVQRCTPLGRPGPALVAFAHRDDDLLFVGRGARGLSRLWRPSVAGYCARHAVCPVLVVPPDALGRRLSGRRGGRELRRDLADFMG